MLKLTMLFLIIIVIKEFLNICIDNCSERLTKTIVKIIHNILVPLFLLFVLVVIYNIDILLSLVVVISLSILQAIILNKLNIKRI